MADHGIIMSAPLVRAMLAGRKSMTRRLLKPQPDTSKISPPFHPEARGGRRWVWMARDDFPGYSFATCDFLVPYAVGDRLWVREAYSGPHAYTGTPPRDWQPGSDIWYWADGNPEDGDWTKPKPGMHMPRWASRLTLTATDVKVERLQSITVPDIEREGAVEAPVADTNEAIGAAFGAWRALWISLHGQPSWDTNPWVVAIAFSVALRNIAAKEAA